MQLKDYNPISMLMVKNTEIEKPKFPVFDAHMHIGALQMKGYGDALFDEPECIASVVRSLKDMGIIGVVNLKMFWGRQLLEYMKSLEAYGVHLWHRAAGSGAKKSVQRE